MKSSEIITDDIISRERRKSQDVVGKKTTSQDYFGNKASTKKVDRDLISKDTDKSMTKKKVDESFRFTEFFPTLKMSDRMELLEDYFCKNKNLLESNDKTKVKQFINLRRYAVTPIPKQKFVFTLVALINDEFKMIESPEVVTFIEKHNNEYIVKDSSNKLKKFPSEYVKEVIITETLFFNNTESYDQFRVMIGMTFDAGMPDIDVDSLLNKSVREDSMQAATHKPQGPKFGGYYGATQKGAPKPGQGFGGAAESVGQELDEVAPPGMEDWVKKNKERFKKEYGDKKGSSVLYATAWKLHNKGKK